MNCTQPKPRQRSCPPTRPAARGAALVVSLLMMLLVTLLGISMMRSVGVESRMIGSSSEKQHAFQAAQTALQYGEWAVQQPAAVATGVSCSGVQGSALICNNAMSSPTSPSSWISTSTGSPVAIAGYPVTPANTSGSSLFSSGAGYGSGAYYAPPQVYIQFLGLTGTDQSLVYQISAIGWGGNANAMAVVQSVFEVSSLTKPLGN